MGNRGRDLVHCEGYRFGVGIEHGALQGLEGFHHTLHQVVGLRHGGTRGLEDSGLYLDALLDVQQVGGDAALKLIGMLLHGFDGVLDSGDVVGEPLESAVDVANDALPEGRIPSSTGRPLIAASSDRSTASIPLRAATALPAELCISRVILSCAFRRDHRRDSNSCISPRMATVSSVSRCGAAAVSARRTAAASSFSSMITSCMRGVRASGSLARHGFTTRSTAGLPDVGVAALAMLDASVAGPSPSNARRPVSISNRMEPKAKTSQRASVARPNRSSGAV